MANENLNTKRSLALSLLAASLMTAGLTLSVTALRAAPLGGVCHIGSPCLLGSNCGTPCTCLAGGGGDIGTCVPC